MVLVIGCTLYATLLAYDSTDDSTTTILLGIIRQDIGASEASIIGSEGHLDCCWPLRVASPVFPLAAATKGERRATAQQEASQAVPRKLAPDNSIEFFASLLGVKSGSIR